MEESHVFNCFVVLETRGRNQFLPVHIKIDGALTSLAGTQLAEREVVKGKHCNHKLINKG
jgi:hypothetical protein